MRLKDDADHLVKYKEKRCANGNQASGSAYQDDGHEGDGSSSTVKRMDPDKILRTEKMG